MLLAVENALAPGEGSLVFRTSGARTLAETCTARSPLKLLAPKNHGSFAWVFAASFGGGLVDGDTVKVRVRVHAGAGAMLGTQSATKVYRSPSGCRQELDASVDEGARLVVLPDPVAPFEGANYTQINEVRLGAQASLVLLDGLTCGRAARGERWDFARYSSRTRVVRNDRLLALDRTLLDPAHGSLRERMGSFDALATLIVVGPHFGAIVRTILSEQAPLTRRPDVLASASPLGDDGAILRVAGVSVEKVNHAVQLALRNLPETLGDDPFARKW